MKTMLAAFSLLITSILPSWAASDRDLQTAFEKTLHRCGWVETELRAQIELGAARYSALPRRPGAISKLAVLPSAVTRLKEAGITETHQLAQPAAQPLIWLNLTEAIRADEPEQALLWAACLHYRLFEAADPFQYTAASLNREFLLQIKPALVNLEGKPYAQSMLGTASLRDLLQDAAGEKEWARIITEGKPAACMDPQELLRYIILRPFHLASNARRHAAMIGAADHYNLNHAKPDLHNVRLACVRSCAPAALSMQVLLESARACAKLEALPVFQGEQVEGLIKEENELHLRAPIADDPFLMPLLLQVDPKATLAVLVQQMPIVTETMLGRHSSILAAQCVSYLQEAGIPYRLLTVRELHDEGPAPDIKTIVFPALVLHSGAGRLSRNNIMGRLQSFHKSGGALLWLSYERLRGVKELIDSKDFTSNLDWQNCLYMKPDPAAQGVKLAYWADSVSAEVRLANSTFISGGASLFDAVDEQGRRISLAGAVGLEGAASNFVYVAPGLLLPGVFSGRTCSPQKMSLDPQQQQVLAEAFARLGLSGKKKNN